MNTLGAKLTTGHKDEARAIRGAGDGQTGNAAAGAGSAASVARSQADAMPLPTASGGHPGYTFPPPDHESLSGVDKSGYTRDKGDPVKTAASLRVFTEIIDLGRRTSATASRRISATRSSGGMATSARPCRAVE